jgi:DNA-binding PucR family transcriptional regulator
MVPNDMSLTAATRAVRSALVNVADDIEADADRLAAELADLLHREIPELGDDPAAREETHRSSRVHMLAVVRTVRHGDRPDRVEPLPEALAFARATVRRGVPLSLVLRAYHLAHGFYLHAWEERLGAAGLDQETLIDATQRLLGITFAFFDGLAQRLTEEYERERERWLRGAQALRAETIRTIVSGEITDPDAAGRVLGYELRRHHVGLVLWAQSEEGEETTLPVLEAAAADIAERLGCARPLVLGVGIGRVWAWSGADAAHDPATLEAIGQAPRKDGVSVGVGDPGEGVDGFRRTHRDADDAARVAMLAGRRPGTVTRYRSVQLGALMAGEVERTRRFVLDHLGPLAAADDETARLRATLKVYLEEHRSRIAAARRLGIHQNTVANRVKACRELLGDELGERSAELQVALTLAQTLGDAVLEPHP